MAPLSPRYKWNHSVSASLYTGKKGGRVAILCHVPSIFHITFPLLPDPCPARISSFFEVHTAWISCYTLGSYFCFPSDLSYLKFHPLWWTAWPTFLQLPQPSQLWPSVTLCTSDESSSSETPFSQITCTPVLPSPLLWGTQPLSISPSLLASSMSQPKLDPQTWHLHTLF